MNESEAERALIECCDRAWRELHRIAPTLELPLAAHLMDLSTALRNLSADTKARVLIRSYGAMPAVRALEPKKVD